MIDIRLRTVVPASELEQKVGKVVTEHDFNVLLTGACRVRKPDGSLLCVYVPGALLEPLDDAYNALHSLKSLKTDNRGLASGTKRTRRGEEKRTRSGKVSSNILGAFDAGGSKQFCRLTAWTGQHFDRYQEVWPLLVLMSEHLRVLVPERHRNQQSWVDKTISEWVIPGTVFSTVTVNNTYPTGVHKDTGDLECGFSALGVGRYGSYTGGELVFPEYRLAVDMNHGDLLLMDAHEWHGNAEMQLTDDAERISVVAYYRTNMKECGTFEDELEKATQYAERRTNVIEGAFT